VISGFSVDFRPHGASPEASSSTLIAPFSFIYLSESL